MSLGIESWMAYEVPSPSTTDFDFDQLKSEFYIESDHHLYSRRLTNEPIVGAGVIVPKRFVMTPFDMSEVEFSDLSRILVLAQEHLDSELAPDGYTVGWNCFYDAGQRIMRAHLHVIPRFSDEEQAGLGLRYWLKENTRPAPNSKGAGRARSRDFWPGAGK